MKLSLDREIFEGKNLILVTGTWDAKLYSASNDEIELLNEFVNENEDKSYSDNEGHFESSGGALGGTVSGSVRENHKEVARKQFQESLRQILAESLNSGEYQKMYYATPEFMKNYTDEVLSEFSVKAAANRVAFKYGDYTAVAPQELVQMIVDFETSNTAELMSEEASKLMHTGEEQD